MEPGWGGGVALPQHGIKQEKSPRDKAGHKSQRSEAKLIPDWTELNIIFDLTPHALL